jgi:hypothetical protein
MKWKYLWTWFPGVLIAIGNGSIRQFWYRQFLGELPAHELSVASFTLLFGIYVWFVVQWLKLSSAGEALRLGVFWLVVTVVFEFVFGHFVMGHPWERLLHDYNVVEGRLWVLVLLWVTAAPVIFYLIQNRKTVAATRTFV